MESFKYTNNKEFGKKEESCKFGPYCEFSTFCKYNEEKCTCYPQCLCESETQLLTTTGEITQGEICDKPNCICDRMCLCKPEQPHEPVSFYRPAECDETKCICDTCLCKPEVSKSDVFPGYFRDTVKKEAYRIMSDDMMTQRREEIKQLLREHEDSKKKEVMTETKDESDTTVKEGEKTVSLQLNIPETIGPLGETSVVSRHDKSTSTAVPRHTVKTEQRQSILHRKKKTSKRKYPTSISASKTKSPTDYSRRQSAKKRPPRIRFYYSGGTECYGVKLGHKHCLFKRPSVPKHMGWLWNREDHTKGIRERKGWPPGFIAKNVKDMINVIKLYQEKTDTHKRKKSISFKMEEEAEPRDEPPILHIRKKGRTYNITFCPKNSDENVGPVPIPFTVREEKGEGSESSESTLEFELHSARAGSKASNVQLVCNIVSQAQVQSTTLTDTQPPPSTTVIKKKGKKQKSKALEENHIIRGAEDSKTQKIPK